MTRAPISLADLLAHVPHSAVIGKTGVAISGVHCDSRRVEPGDLFAAIKGFKEDGKKYAADAVSRGARAVLSRDGAPAGWNHETPWVVSPREREAFSAACASVYDTRESAVRVVGVTGTNGKTTSAYLMRAIFQRAGGAGMLGTIEYDDGGGLVPASRTTPEADEIHRWLRRLSDAGIAYGAMEVSSHSLELSRVRDVRFKAAAFTNLTRDHLDFHKNMEAYYIAKRKLFSLLTDDGAAVINIDDPYGMRLAQELDAKKLVRAGGGPPAHVYPKDTVLDIGGIRCRLVTPWGEVAVKSPLVGRFNLQNILVAAAAALAAGASKTAVEEGIAGLTGVPGRLERISRGQPFSVFVDYAHTDDALKNLLLTLKDIGSGRIITLFGCGGDRDRTKRPLMGAVVARQSDVIVLTSDNPRTERPEAIADDVEKGLRPEVSSGKKYLRVLDRRSAIKAAFEEAREGDIVVLAGKGHERVQIRDGKETPFHDPSVAAEVLGEMGWR